MLIPSMKSGESFCFDEMEISSISSYYCVMLVDTLIANVCHCRGNTAMNGAGLGIDRPAELSKNDDEYDAYRKRMMLAYRFRPNPLVKTVALALKMLEFKTNFFSLPHLNLMFSCFCRIIHGDHITDAEHFFFFISLVSDSDHNFFFCLFTFD